MNKVQKCSKELYGAMVSNGMIAAPSSCTVDSIVLCPVCQRGDVWQEAVNRTEYVYKGEAVKDGQEVIDYLLAEVATLLETQNAESEVSE